VHLFAATKAMGKRCFYNSDGDLLIVPQEGRLSIQTEFGVLDIQPGFIAVIQRGIRFSVSLPDKRARGYICENYGPAFRLPYRGPIGANGLANQRDFQYPVASFIEDTSEYEIVTKFQGQLFACVRQGSPFDVVAWHGNYAPYRYDLNRFNTINTVGFDHPDPSIFTVLTSPSLAEGTANIDFVIFPPRWMVAENTFRPPWFHRNIMSEYMGLIHGVYDAKPGGGGFVPGGGSLHNCMSAHGPDAEAFEKASAEQLTPKKYENTLAFMFESNAVYQPTQAAFQRGFLQEDYLACWQGLKANFKS
jgi:homogentisate 1,2-dioxygenase